MSDDDHPYLPEVITYRWETYDEPITGMEPGGTPDFPPDDVREVEVERDVARQVVRDIHEAIERRSRSYVIVEVILGAETYLKADVYCRTLHEIPIDAHLGVDVTVIPGDMIEPVIPTEKRIEEHLREGERRHA